MYRGDIKALNAGSQGSSVQLWFGYTFTKKICRET